MGGEGGMYVDIGVFSGSDDDDDDEGKDVDVDVDGEEVREGIVQDKPEKDV